MKYGQRVRITSGFYEGQEGIVIREYNQIMWRYEVMLGLDVDKHKVEFDKIMLEPIDTI